LKLLFHLQCSSAILLPIDHVGVPGGTYLISFKFSDEVLRADSPKTDEESLAQALPSELAAKMQALSESLCADLDFDIPVLRNITSVSDTQAPDTDTDTDTFRKTYSKFCRRPRH